MGVTQIDDGKDLVDMSIFPRLEVGKSRTRVQQLSDNPFQVRSSVAERIARAQAYLPDGYQLQIKEGWRPIWVQERLWQQSLGQLRASRPDLSDDELRRENTRFTAPPDNAPPHSTGGAAPVTRFLARSA